MDVICWRPIVSPLAGALLLLSTATTALASAAQASFTDDDRLVLFAVFEQSIRPWVSLERNIMNLPDGPVLVAPDSLPACPTGATNGAALAVPSHVCASVEALRTADSQGLVIGAWEYREETRQALVEAFNARNATVAPLPLDDLVDARAVAGRSATDRNTAGGSAAGEGSPDFLIQVTRPAYISNGFAMVYAQATRGGRLMQGWAFVLNRFSGRWLVQHAYLLWIRQ